MGFGRQILGGGVETTKAFIKRSEKRGGVGSTASKKSSQKNYHIEREKGISRKNKKRIRVGALLNAC